MLGTEGMARALVLHRSAVHVLPRARTLAPVGMLLWVSPYGRTSLYQSMTAIRPALCEQLGLDAQREPCPTETSAFLIGRSAFRSRERRARYASFNASV